MVSAVWLGLAIVAGVYCVMTLVRWERERRERAATRRALTERLTRLYETVLDVTGQLSQRHPAVPASVAEISPSMELDIAEEASAFLSGRYQGHLESGRQSAPAWAWLNPLAHGTIDDVEAIAARAPSATGPEAIVAAIAVQIASAVRRGAMRLEHVQRQTLIPLEEHLTAVLLPTATDDEEAARILVAAIVERPLAPPGDGDE